MCSHPTDNDLSVWGDYMANHSDAKFSAVQRALDQWTVAQSAGPVAQAGDSATGGEGGREGGTAEAAAGARAQVPSTQGYPSQGPSCQGSVSQFDEFDLVYSAGHDAEVAGKLAVDVDPADIDDLLAAFERAPLARDVVHVQEIRRVRQDSTCHRRWELEVEKLQQRAEADDFPKPSWMLDTNRSARQREREEVWWHLLSSSRRHPKATKVWTARIFHGCTESAAKSILTTGFASNVQATKGWFGEGIYATTSATYGLRYGLGMTDFWDNPGKSAFVIAGRAAFSEVYPVTQADDESPLQTVDDGCVPRTPGLKGKRIACAPGAKGCNAHFVCVRRHEPFGEHKNATYHPCAEGERPDGTELVVNQESQYLPEYLVKVKICDDPELCAAVRQASLSWGRHSQPRQDAATPALAEKAPSVSAGTDGSSQRSTGGASYCEELHVFVHQKLKLDPFPPGIINYDKTEQLNGEFVCTVRVKWDGPDQEPREFKGEPQPRKVAAQQSAAKAALDCLKKPWV